MQVDPRYSQLTPRLLSPLESKLWDMRSCCQTFIAFHFNLRHYEKEVLRQAALRRLGVVTTPAAPLLLHTLSLEQVGTSGRGGLTSLFSST